jgi:hypothetical protein
VHVMPAAEKRASRDLGMVAGRPAFTAVASALLVPPGPRNHAYTQNGEENGL